MSVNIAVLSREVREVVASVPLRELTSKPSLVECFGKLLRRMVAVAFPHLLVEESLDTLISALEDIRERISLASEEDLKRWHDSLYELTDKCLDILGFFRSDAVFQNKLANFLHEYFGYRTRKKILCLRDLVFAVVNDIEIELSRRKRESSIPDQAL